jgi:hypothetical protein
MTTSSPPATVRRPRWPWLILALGLAWTAIIRIPLILNAEDHLDSDLAVDGLTLLDAANGRWRWHYPGTPYMGIVPVLASYPQALMWGANPITLVSGGTVLWGLVVLSTFVLALRAYGPAPASWAIVPLVFSSMGTLWLSGRITGGHLLAAAWHPLAFVGFYVSITRGGWRSAALLGVWCGLGVSIDAMLLLTIAGIAAAASIGWLSASRSRRGIVLAATFLAGLVIGLLPREIGRRLDPYDAYPAQFAATFDPDAVTGHAGLLGLECLPRLFAGTRLEAAVSSPDARGASASVSAAGGWALLLLVAFATAIARLAVAAVRDEEPARRAIAAGTLLSGVMIVAAFLVNQNIYNSDNYRYLVFLLTPWSLGFGLCLGDLSHRGARGRMAAGMIAVLLAAGMTIAAFRWYRDTRHYLDDRGFPMRREHPPWSELTILPDRARKAAPRPAPGRPERYTIPSDVSHVFGGYWDVYRLSFLSGKRIVGVPYPMYPNRFRGWSGGLGPGRGKILILRPGEESASASRPAAEMPGGRPERVRSARAIDWRPALATAWAADGRDPTEIERLTVVVP